MCKSFNKNEKPSISFYIIIASSPHTSKFLFLPFDYPPYTLVRPIFSVYVIMLLGILMYMVFYFWSFLLPASSLFPSGFSFLFASFGLSHVRVSSDVCDLWMIIHIYEGDTKKDYQQWWVYGQGFVGCRVHCQWCGCTVPLGKPWLSVSLDQCL